MLPHVAKETTAYLDQPLREQDFNGLLEEGEESRVVDADPFPQQGQNMLHLHKCKWEVLFLCKIMFVVLYSGKYSHPFYFCYFVPIVMG